MLFHIFVISLSVSIDALGIGVSYELKGIRVGIISRIIIGIVSGIVMLLSLKGSERMLEYFPPDAANLVGTAILILIGVVFIRNALFGNGETICDLDKSKDINLGEALLLGFALSADCISVGIAAATLGIGSMAMPVCVGVMQALLMWLGKKAANSTHCKGIFDSRKSGVLAGCILIFMGIFRNL